MHQPDAIASYRVGAHTFLVTANEGDAREYDGFGEAVRIGTVSLDPKRFPNGAALKNSANLGRLNIAATGGQVARGEVEFGGRSLRKVRNACLAELDLLRPPKNFAALRGVFPVC